MSKYIYRFGDGKAEGSAAMKNLLGGKGCGLAEMNLIGIPVPPGFTITTEVCNLYTKHGPEHTFALIKADVEASLHQVE
jgi:pyruvate,orthophosphate dikinase